LEKNVNVLYAVVLGIVQGLTEFLPVSSSGHLVLLQKIFGITEPALFFDTMLHLGTLTAVFTVLWKDIWEIIKKPFQPLTVYLLLATIPAVILALAKGDAIENAFESGRFLGVCFLVTTAFLLIAELLSRRAAADNCLKKAENIKPLDAVIIGMLQASAVTPGISRSGAAISGALFRRLERDFAARFSFLLSIPAILGAVILQTKNIMKSGMSDNVTGGVSAAAVTAGTLIAAVTGFFAIRFMLKIIREKSLFGFAVYTAVLGILILFDQMVTHIVF
jgi:undecaprenyl-diphosphatase